MKAKRFLKKIGQLELSYVPEAPDHGWPELAVILGKRVVPVAVGTEATTLWHHPLDEAGFRALAVAEASLLAVAEASLLAEQYAAKEKLVSN